MGRYIDADELTREVEAIIESNKKNLDINPRTKEIYLLGMKHTLDFVKVTPPIDVVKVVRCKDCRYCEEYHYEEKGEKPYIKLKCKWSNYSHQPNDFCNYGERKEENE